MTNYIYGGFCKDYGCFTVGFYDPSGEFIPASDHSSAEAAAARVNFLNGGESDMLRQITIGKYSVCLDVNTAGDLQIRVYPIDANGITWHCPANTFDILRRDITEAEQAME
jgi:hypothetical protein